MEAFAVAINMINPIPTTTRLYNDTATLVEDANREIPMTNNDIPP